MNIAELLIDYRNTRNDIVFGDVSSIDKENLIIIVTELLSWLKLERKREIFIEQGRKTKLKPMELNMNYPWCKDLEKLLSADNSFSELFDISNNALLFKECVSDEYAHESRVLADEKYNPQMIIG
ncbi:MAG: hypothetical protein K6E46_01530 [Lachnospiraceae bacterium]|nr:hypothetical protein [Lachnospiraceae bacterium]